MKRYLAALALSLVPCAAFGQSVAVFVTQQINLSDEEVQAFATVCSDTYSRASQHPAIPPDQASKALQDNGNATAAAAQAIGASDYLDFQLVRLGDSANAKILVMATRIMPGGPPRQARIDMASLADAPAACDRIARATLNNTSVDDVADRTNVTRAEAQSTAAPTRLGLERLPYAKFSFGAPLQSGYQPIGSLRAGVDFERDQVMLELGAGFILPAFSGSGTGYGGLVTEVGLNYLFSESNNSLFAGVGFEPRLNFGGAVLELAPYVQVGGMLWRDTSARLFAELRLAQNLLPVTDSGNIASGNTTPTEVSLYIGVAF